MINLKKIFIFFWRGSECHKKKLNWWLVNYANYVNLKWQFNFQAIWISDIQKTCRSKKHAESEPADKLKTLRRHCKGKACICRLKPVRVPDAVEIQCDHSVQISGTEKVLSVSWLHAIVPLNRNVHLTHFLSSNFRHSASLALSQSANLQLKKLPLTAHFLNWQSDSSGQFKLSTNLAKSLQQLTNQRFKHTDSMNQDHVSSIISAGIWSAIWN